MPIPAPKNSFWKSIGIGAAVAVLIVAAGIFSLRFRIVESVPPVLAPIAPAAPDGPGVGGPTNWTVAIWLVGLVILSFLLWKGISALWKRIQRRQRDKVAAAAESYFQSLGR